MKKSSAKGFIAGGLTAIVFLLVLTVFYLRDVVTGHSEPRVHMAYWSVVGGSLLFTWLRVRFSKA